MLSEIHRKLVIRVGDVTSTNFFVFACDVFIYFFTNSGSPKVLGPVVALQNYMVLPFLPCKTADFQGWGGDPQPHMPLKFCP